MIPSPQSQITVFFRNGASIQGEVISWSDTQSVLKAPGVSNFVVIQKTLDDVLYYRFSTIDVKKEIAAKIDIPNKKPTDIEDIAKLKGELILLEKEEIGAKLSSHEISGNQGLTKYGNGKQLLTIARPIEHTREEARGSGDEFSEGLQNLFDE